MIRRLVVAVLAAASIVAVAPVARADGPTIHGAGSTWVQIALSQWASDVSRYGMSVDYQGTGSTAGRQNYMYNLIDFAATEIPYQPEELSQYHHELGDRFRDFQYLPDVAGGTSFMYNLVDDATGQRITNLKLTPTTIAKIFTGKVPNWNDATIAGDNPGVNLPNKPLIPVVRSDSAGSSAQLSLFLSHAAPDVWRSFSQATGCPDVCQNWPTDRPFVGQSLSSGVTNYVSSTPNTINYVEAGYALAKGFPVAYVRNASGNWALPTSPNVATALTHAKLHSDLTQDLTSVYSAPEASAYPVSSYSYLITPTSKMDPAKGKVLGNFIKYVVCQGQNQAPLLGYSPIPPNLVQVAFDAINRINGHDPTPDLNTQAGRDACPNPTFKKSATEIPGASGPQSTPGAGAAAAGLGLGATAGGGTSNLTGGNGVLGANESGPTATVGPNGQPISGGEGSAVAMAYTRRKAALNSVSNVRSATSTPLVLAALYVPVLVFLPVLRRRRRGGAR